MSAATPGEAVLDGDIAVSSAGAVAIFERVALDLALFEAGQGRPTSNSADVAERLNSAFDETMRRLTEEGFDKETIPRTLSSVVAQKTLGGTFRNEACTHLAVAADLSPAHATCTPRGPGRPSDPWLRSRARGTRAIRSGPTENGVANGQERVEKYLWMTASRGRRAAVTVM